MNAPARNNESSLTPVLLSELERRGISETQFQAVRDSIFPGARLESIMMAFDYCQARGLDIMLKPVHLVPMNVKDAQTNQYSWRDVPMPGIGLYRIQASRSGNHAGTDEPEFGPTITDTLGGTEVSYPEWCRVTVYKIVGGQRVPFSAVERWVENYATQKRDSDAPNAMWKKRAFGQIAKCFDEQTEVLTTEGFERFGEVTGRVLQATDRGLAVTDAKPFMQSYDGPMVTANGTRLNFCVTPNHDMITNRGRVEAGSLYELATACSGKWVIPRTVSSSRGDADVSDQVLALVGYLLADGSHSGFHQYRIAVSRTYKVAALESLALHERQTTKRDAGRVSSGLRDITTISDKQAFTYDEALVEGILSSDKSINPEWVISLSARQARITVDALLEFDGSFNGTVRRLHQSNVNVIKAFELLAVQAGYSISAPALQRSDLGDCSLFTVSGTTGSPVVKGVSKNSASLSITPNVGGKVWCVTVPSGVIVVRRNGFSMLCGNCAEAQALRKAWPEIGSEPTAEEMMGKGHMEGEERDITPSQPERQAPESLPFYPSEKLEANLPAWRDAIENKGRSAETVIRMVSSRYQLTDDQKRKIRDIEGAEA